MLERSNSISISDSSHETVCRFTLGVTLLSDYRLTLLLNFARALQISRGKAQVEGRVRALRPSLEYFASSN